MQFSTQLPTLLSVLEYWLYENFDKSISAFKMIFVCNFQYSFDFLKVTLKWLSTQFFFSFSENVDDFSNIWFHFLTQIYSWILILNWKMSRFMFRHSLALEYWSYKNLDKLFFIWNGFECNFRHNWFFENILYWFFFIVDKLIFRWNILNAIFNTVFETFLSLSIGFLKMTCNWLQFLIQLCP